MTETKINLDKPGAFCDILSLIRLSGLSAALGRPGEYTCYARDAHGELTVNVLPGTFSSEEIEALYKAAGIEVSPLPQVMPMAA